MSMDKDIAKFRKLFQEENTRILRDTTTRVSGSLLRLSPVADPDVEERGEFVSNWEFARNAFPEDADRPPDPGKNTTRARIKAEIAAMEFGDQGIFENADPVAVQLEMGYSKKAPQGVVRLTARRWRSFVRGAGRAAQGRVNKALADE